MANKRSKDKGYIGWWASMDLRDRLKQFTKAQDTTETAVLNEALEAHLDKNETTQTKEQDQ